MVQEEIIDGVDGVPVSPLLSAERRNRYGSVPGLADEELADPDELERRVMLEEWGLIMALPTKAKGSNVWAAIRQGDVDFNAFASVDFQRTMPEFDKARYKADKLREKLKDVVIMAEMVRDRLPRQARRQVLIYLRRGVIELEHIINDDMVALVRLYLRAKKLRQEIAELQEASYRKRHERAERFWASL